MEDLPESEIPEDLRQAAVDARRFVQDPTTKRIMAMCAAHFIKEIERSPHDGQAIREHCYLMLKALREFQSHLTKLASTGTLEERRRSRRDGNGIA